MNDLVKQNWTAIFWFWPCILDSSPSTTKKFSASDRFPSEDLNFQEHSFSKSHTSTEKRASYKNQMYGNREMFQSENEVLFLYLSFCFSFCFLQNCSEYSSRLYLLYSERGMLWSILLRAKNYCQVYREFCLILKINLCFDKSKVDWNGWVRSHLSNRTPV